MKIKLLKSTALFAGTALTVILLAGCASTNISNREQLVTGFLPRPATIWVYNFAATAADVPTNSALAGEDLDNTPQTAEQIAEGMKLGDQIATELTAQINAMGMNAQQASLETKPQINDIVIRGYLISVKQGSTIERVAIGFGAGKSSLSTMVEGFQMTAKGLRKLGFGTVATFLATKNPAGLIINAGVQTYGEASGNDEVTGRAKATAKKIADVLKNKFTDQGWIY
jgi:hypothetical protein